MVWPQPQLQYLPHEYALLLSLPPLGVHFHMDPEDIAGLEEASPVIDRMLLLVPGSMFHSTAEWSILIPVDVVVPIPLLLPVD